ncbi:hypothetical protein [Bradyrhizobium lupini]|uniref:hypothetical protein n=1 Tax=Rhizobium lupini TaxID=136996 RepID=UPI0034C609EB
MTSSSFYTDGETYDTAVVTSNDHPGSTTPSQSPSSFYATGGVVGEGTVVSNETGPGEQSDTPSSFYTDGAVYDTAIVESNDKPDSTTPSQAPSSFYPAGTIYDWLNTESEVVALLQQLADTTTTNANSASTSATQAGTYASQAATSASHSATAVQDAAGTLTPIMDGTAAVGASTRWAHEDHVHPKDPSLASVDYVDTKVAGVVNSAPATLDTLNELATALGDDPNFATTVATQIGTKADKTYVDTQDAALLAKLFPSGTTMLFHQSTAPPGWTKRTDHNDKALRVTSGTVTAGGSNPFSTVNAQTTVGSTALTAAQIPTITSAGSNTITVYPNNNGGYYYPMGSGAGWGGVTMNVYPIANYGSYSMAYFGTSAGNITYSNYMQGVNSIGVTSNNTGGAAHTHSITMNVQYIDVILAQKD